MAAGILYGINWGPNNTAYFGSGYPTSSSDGSFNQGDIIFNAYPSDQGYFAWLCIATGSPGSWSKVLMSTVT